MPAAFLGCGCGFSCSLSGLLQHIHRENFKLSPSNRGSRRFVASAVVISHDEGITPGKVARIVFLCHPSQQTLALARIRCQREIKINVKAGGPERLFKTSKAPGFKKSTRPRLTQTRTASRPVECLPLATRFEPAFRTTLLGFWI